MVITPGVTIGRSPEIGSVGLILKSVTSDAVVALSCSHVLALSGYAAVGDDIVSDGGRVKSAPYSKIGTLGPSFTKLMTTAVNDSDFAVCTLDLSSGIVVQPEVPGLGSPSAVSNLDALHFSSFQQTQVTRVGASTGRQEGVIVGWPGEVVGFAGLPVVGTVGNINVIIYETVCDPGDSGAAVVTGNGEVLGIHLGGLSDQGIGYLCPLGQTLTRWGFALA
jgi:hypothetical protein